VIRFADAGRTEEFAEKLSVADKQKEARAMQVAVHRAYLQRVRADPERLERYKSARSIASKKQYQRITKDPERYEKILSGKQKNYKDLSWRDKHTRSTQR
jgi:hypothetical protein